MKNASAAFGYLNIWRTVFLFFLFFVFFWNFSAAQFQGVNFTGGNFQIQFPPYVTTTTVSAWGGGGAGGGVNNSNGSKVGAGGGGGAFVQSNLAVSGNIVYNGVAGPRGIGVDAGNGNPGNDSWFVSNTTLLAKGGAGGGFGTTTNYGAPGTGGLLSASIGDLRRSGGTGTQGSRGSYSGAGGGSGGFSSNGGNAVNGTGGVAGTGTPAGAAGANGRTGNNPGSAGTVPGSGGSGSYRGSGTNTSAGGDGGDGRVNITYEGYCRPFVSNNSTYINNFSTSGGIVNINKVSTGIGAYGYQNFYDTDVISVNEGDNFTATFNLVGGTAGVSIWIDYDKNNVFDAGEVVYSSGAFLPNGNTTTPSIVIPIGTTPGDYVIRIITDWYAMSPGACGSTRGEAEDYKLTVMVPSCPAPTNLSADNVTGTSADLSWTGSGSSYDFEWGAVGFTQGTGTMVTGASNPYPLGGLTPNTNYEYYVRANCGGGDYSAWAGPYNFRTTCGSIIDEFPYTETFEMDSDLLGCWVVYGYTTLQTWYLSQGNYSGSITNAHNGERNALYYTGSDIGFPAILASPRMDISGLTSPSVSFWYSNEAWFGDIDELRVYYKSSYGAPWTLIPGAVYTTTHSNWTYVELNLPNASDEYYVGFEGIGEWGHGITLDDVTFYDAAADCKYTNTYQADGNWSYANPGPVDNSDKKVVVKGNLTVNSEDEYCSVEVRPSGNLQVNSNLTVSNEVKNLATSDRFVVASDANLKQVNPGTNTGDITVRRMATVPSNQYNYWASPVVGQDLYDLYPNLPPNRVMTYNTWDDYFTILPSNTNPVSSFGIGYSIKGPTSNSPQNSSGGTGVTASFVGVPQNESLIPEENNIMVTTFDNDDNFNLIGNPFPSNLDLEKFYNDDNDNNPTTGNAAKFETPSVYFWDNIGNTEIYQQGSGYSQSNYAIYNMPFGGGTAAPCYEDTNCTISSGKKPNGIVKPGQGFIINVKQGETSLTVNNDMRTTALKINPTDGDAEYFKNGSNLSSVNDEAKRNDKFWLELINPAGTRVQTAIGYFERAENTFEVYDSEILSESVSENIYTLSHDNVKLAIQGRKGLFHDDDEIPLVVKLFEEGRYKIQLEETKGIFISYQNIYLKDKLLGVIHNLSDSGAYEFEADAGVHNDRFEIVFKDGTSAGPVLTAASQVHIRKINKEIVISSTKDKLMEVEIFNFDGWSVYKNTNVNALELKIPAQKFGKQIIVIKAQTESGEIVTRKMINK